MKKYILVILMVIVCTINCKWINSDELLSETKKLVVAYTFLLNELQNRNYTVIASENNEDLNIIHNIINTNNFNFEVEQYSDLEKHSSLCYYSKFTKKIVTIISVIKKDEDKYYLSYYLGPEGGASKEIEIVKRKGNWVVANDDKIWAIK